MTTIEVPSRTVIRLSLTNSKQRFKWSRDESAKDPKTDVQVRGTELIATNFTHSSATLTLLDS